MDRTSGAQAGSAQPNIRTSAPLRHTAVAPALISKSHVRPFARSFPRIVHGSVSNACVSAIVTGLLRRKYVSACRRVSDHCRQSAASAGPSPRAPVGS